MSEIAIIYILLAIVLVVIAMKTEKKGVLFFMLILLVLSGVMIDRTWESKKRLVDIIKKTEIIINQNIVDILKRLE